MKDLFVLKETLLNNLAYKFTRYAGKHYPFHRSCFLKFFNEKSRGVIPVAFLNELMKWLTEE